jgi:integrase
VGRNRTRPLGLDSSSKPGEERCRSSCPTVSARANYPAGRAPVREKSDEQAVDDKPDLVFPGEQGVFSGWSKSKGRLDRRGGIAGWTLHDSRRTVATGLQKLGVRLEVTEAVLNHVAGSRAGIIGVYQRHTWSDEKRAALNAWGEHVGAIVEGRESGGNVTLLRRSG